MTTTFASAGEFGLPLACELGKTCFVQQTPDLDPGPDATDSFCRKATYDGHDGWDFRLVSLNDVARGIEVLAVADGRVLRARDGIADSLVQTAEQRSALQSRECGNGVVIAHAHGLETQYCHMRRGSIVVHPGEMVLRGQPIGQIGYSGLATFPHVHLSVRRNGAAIDPLTGADLALGPTACGDFSDSQFTSEIRAALDRPTTALLETGLAEVPPELQALVEGRSPARPHSGSTAALAWVWSINLDEGAQIRIRIMAPDGTIFAESLSPPLDRRKANYLYYAGRKASPMPGKYSVAAEIIGKLGVIDRVQVEVDLP